MELQLTKIDRGEALRYLGIRGSLPPEDQLPALLDACEARLLETIHPKAVLRVFPLKQEPLRLVGCTVPLLGQDIRRHLEGCHSGALFCATLTGEADRLIDAAQRRNMAEALCLDALANAAVEQVCDQVCSDLKRRLKDCWLTWRFSPGYGDFPLSVQSDFLAALQAEKRLGISLQQSGLLRPLKTVTAVVGISNTAPSRQESCCERCMLAERCSVRKGGSFCGSKNQPV